MNFNPEIVHYTIGQTIVFWVMYIPLFLAVMSYFVLTLNPMVDMSMQTFGVEDHAPMTVKSFFLSITLIPALTLFMQALTFILTGLVFMGVFNGNSRGGNS